MIRWEDIYKVVAAMAPLYFALVLGYGSIKWWSIFTNEQSKAINRFVCYFTIPFLALDFTSHVNPYKMNYPFIAADAISKGVTVAVLGIWARFSSKGSFSWAITYFSLSCLSNGLIIGVPLLKAMFGSLGADLVRQSAVLQIGIWTRVLILVLEVHKMMKSTVCLNTNEDDLEPGKELEGREIGNGPSFWWKTKTVCVKFMLHPITYACGTGITWSFIANRWNLQIPGILEGCIQILSTSGIGTSMFSLGIFMAQQEKMIACGTNLTIFALILRYISGPAAMLVGSLAVGLHGDVLRIAIIQAALPPSLAAFVWLKEYGLHANVLSTTVTIGTILSIPVLMACYAVAKSIS